MLILIGLDFGVGMPFVVTQGVSEAATGFKAIASRNSSQKNPALKRHASCKCSSKTALRTLAHLAGGEDHFREKAREAAMKPPLGLNKLGLERCEALLGLRLLPQHGLRAGAIVLQICHLQVMYIPCLRKELLLYVGFCKDSFDDLVAKAPIMLTGRLGYRIISSV